MSIQERVKAAHSARNFSYPKNIQIIIVLDKADHHRVVSYDETVDATATWIVTADSVQLTE